MKRFFAFFILGLWGFLLCAKVPEKRQYSTLVQKIELYSKHDDRFRHYVVEDDENISLILNYLRSNRSMDTTENIPPVLPRNSFTIKVHLSNHKLRIYQQVEHRYFRKDNGLWMRISPKRGAALQNLEKRLQQDHFSPPKKPYF